MSAFQDPNNLVRAYLQNATKPVTAVDVRIATKLPHPVVTRSLLNMANELVPEVERTEEEGQFLYRYIAGAKRVLSTEKDKPRSAPLKKVKPAKVKATAKDKKAHAKTEPEQREPLMAAEKAKPIKASKKTLGKITKAPKKSQAEAPAETGSIDKDAFITTEFAPYDPSIREKGVPPTNATRELSPTSNSMRTYELIAEHLVGVPMNLSRIAKLTGLSPEVLLPAMKTLSAAGLVSERDVMGSAIYKPLGDLKEKIKTESLPIEAESSTGAESAQPVLPGEVVEFVKAVGTMLTEESDVAEQLVKLCTGITEHVKKLIEERDHWRKVAENFVARLEAA